MPGPGVPASSKARRSAVLPLFLLLLSLPILAGSLLVSLSAPAATPPVSPAAGSPGPQGNNHRATLVEAILSQDLEEQTRLLRPLSEQPDPTLTPVLSAWRGGTVYLHEVPGQPSIPFLLDAVTDPDGRARGFAVLDGKPILGEDGQPALLSPTDLLPADTSSKLRRVIKAVLDVLALSDRNPRMRRDAVVKVGQERSLEHLPTLEERLGKETDAEVRRALEEAIALTQTASPDLPIRIEALRTLGRLNSITSLSFLQDHAKKLRDNPSPERQELAAARAAVRAIENYAWWGNLTGTAFRGLSLAAVLLVAALGLAITFGLMGIINMAHGELMMVGAYTAYVVQNAFESAFGSGGLGFETYFLAALPAAFAASAGVGVLLERGVIRFLYRRPLESLLATWGVSLLLQQVFRHVFGAANVQVGSPRWLSGSLVIHDVLFAYNRLFVIAFAGLIVGASWMLLTRTSLGLQIRAVMQNRAMASTLGVRTTRINLLTFAYGSGLAGMAGACLSQIGNVGPSLGQNYIVDCFMIVVLGGVGNLVGTVSASLGVGVTDQILQPWLGAVMGKITVLGAIILFLQWRPAGLFATRSRNLEG